MFITVNSFKFAETVIRGLWKIFIFVYTLL